MNDKIKKDDDNISIDDDSKLNGKVGQWYHDDNHLNVNIDKDKKSKSGQNNKGEIKPKIKFGFGKHDSHVLINKFDGCLDDGIIVDDKQKDNSHLDLKYICNDIAKENYYHN